MTFDLNLKKITHTHTHAHYTYYTHSQIHTHTHTHRARTCMQVYLHTLKAMVNNSEKFVWLHYVFFKICLFPVLFPLPYCHGICQVVLIKPSCSVCVCPGFFFSCDTSTGDSMKFPGLLNYYLFLSVAGQTILNHRSQ